MNTKSIQRKSNIVDTPLGRTLFILGGKWKMKITDTDHGYNVHIGVGASITTFPNNKHIPFLVTHT